MFGLLFSLRIAGSVSRVRGSASASDVQTIRNAINHPTASLELEPLIYDLLAQDGHFTTAAGTLQPMGTIPWGDLIALLVQYLPQIIALIMSLLNPIPVIVSVDKKVSSTTLKVTTNKRKKSKVRRKAA